MHILLLTFLVSRVLTQRTTDEDLASLEADEPCLKGSFSFDGWGYNAAEYPCELCGAGEYAGEEGLDECGPCPAGSFTPDTGYWACEKCPAGSITDEEYSSECYPCYHGQYSPAEGGTSCHNCPAGSYQDAEGAAQCKLCPEGHYQDTPASDSCLTCPAGTSSVQGSSTAGACTACPAGHYAASDGSKCAPCPVLTYNDVVGAVACKDCPSNTDAEAATECGVSCEAGEVLVEGTCTPCPAGQFAAAGATQCDPCPAGSYSGSTGAVQCDLCPELTYGPTEGLEKCLDCPGNAEAGMTECKVECPAGQIEDESGNCVPCDAGTFQKEGECVSCEGGSYSDSEGSVECQECPAGSYCPPGAVSPTDCPTGNYCPAAAAAASPCSTGSYNPEAGSDSVEDCLACPGGSYCDSEGLSAPTGTCSPGYFCPDGSTSAQENASPAGTYCPGGASAPTPCPRNTFREGQAGTSAADCDHCPAGKQTLDTGATSADACKDVNCNPGYYKDEDKGCVICPKGTFSKVNNADSCTPCPRHHYNSIAGSEGCLKCPDTAYTWEEGTDSFDKCIGPVIEVCSEVQMEGTCHRYYDNNLQVDTTIQSLQVIRGEFEVYEGANLAGEYATVSETDGPLDVEDEVTVEDVITVTKVLSFKAVINDLFCYLDKGVDFRGRIRTTAMDGKPCINWSETSMADIAEHNNYCQNPKKSDPSAQPFCFTDKTSPTLCDIPACIWDMACYTGIGAQYRGEQDTTDHTKTCQNWESDWPHPHSYHADQYSWAGIGNHNFCRNPDEEGSGKPWCYTTSLNPWYWWDYCTVARCDRDQFEFYRF